MAVNSLSPQAAITDLVGKIDPAAFLEKFGSDISMVDKLVGLPSSAKLLSSHVNSPQKTVTIYSKLLVKQCPLGGG